LYAFLTSSMRAICPAHLILLDLMTIIIFCEAPHYAVFSIFSQLMTSEVRSTWIRKQLSSIMGILLTFLRIFIRKCYRWMPIHSIYITVNIRIRWGLYAS
jgi:hypothetical protein